MSDEAWREGKTPHSIAFVEEAERFLEARKTQRGISSGIGQSVRYQIQLIKGGDVILTEPETVEQFLAKSRRV